MLVWEEIGGVTLVEEVDTGRGGWGMGFEVSKAHVIPSMLSALWLCLRCESSGTDPVSCLLVHSHDPTVTVADPPL